jgi:predicted permease
MALMTTLRGLFQRRRAEREVDDELAFHLEMETQAHIARGMAPEAARRAALAAFGGMTQAKEAVREVRTLGIETAWYDLRHAVRALTAQARVSLAAAGMLALAIAIATAMFTIVDSLLIRPVPFPEPEQLAHLWMRGERGGRTVVAPAVLKAWRESPAFDAAESASSDTALLEAGGTVVTRELATVTPGVFRMLGVTPLHGRLFDATEGRPGEADRLLVSETLWRGLFNADPSLVGQTISVNGERVTVIGILPSEFVFPSADTVLWRPTDLSAPDQMAVAYVRFARGVPREDALRLAGEAAHAADAYTARQWAATFPLAGLDDDYSQQAVPLLTGGVALVFLVLCANVCSLLLARLTSRRREFSMRAALGAPRSRLVRLTLLESAVLGVIGVAAGAGIAWAFVTLARVVMPEPLLLQSLNPLSLDTRALAVTSATGLAATLTAGVLPAWLGTRVDPGESLRVVERGGTETRGARAVTRALLVVEVSLAVTLLVGATLLTRSFVNLAGADRGLDTSNVTTLWLNFTATRDAAGRATLARAVERELRSLPGVRQVAWSYGLPPGGGVTSFGDWFSDVPGAPALNMEVASYYVSREFFSLYGIPIIRGRGFDESDPFTNVIVSERLAQTLWPGGDPVGHTFRFDEAQFQVVGVAREIHYPTVDVRRDGPEFYHPHTSVAFTPMVSVRCEPDCPDAAVIRQRLAATHPAIRVQDAGPVDRRYVAELVRPRAAAALAITFAAVALIAAAGGLFSVLSYAVNRRRRELGVRTALGASAARLRRSVLGDAAIVTASGLAIGSIFAMALARTLSALQYGITSADPASWAIVLGLIALTTMLASWGPAHAAATVDPMVLLRDE